MVLENFIMNDVLMAMSELLAVEESWLLTADEDGTRALYLVGCGLADHERALADHHAILELGSSCCCFRNYPLRLHDGSTSSMKPSSFASTASPST